jgi:hypothetical protein
MTDSIWSENREDGDRQDKRHNSHILKSKIYGGDDTQILLN